MKCRLISLQVKYTKTRNIKADISTDIACTILQNERRRWSAPIQITFNKIDESKNFV